MKVWINGKLTDAKDAKVSVFDRGFLYGDGLFETMRSYDGKIFKIDEHLSRLFDSSEALKINIPYSKKRLREASYNSIKRNSLKDAYIRITVTRDENVIILTKEFSGYLRRNCIDGISAQVSKIVLNEHSPLAGKKTLNFLNYLLAKEDARANGYGEAILLNTKDNVAEGSTSNIFLIKNRKLLTPPLNDGILPGITRRTVIDLAKKLRIAVAEKHVSSEELISADEVFLTNSLVELLPIIKVNRTTIGNGKPGPVTKVLHATYQKMV